MGLTGGMGRVGCVGGHGTRGMHEWACMTKGGGGHGKTKGAGWVQDVLVGRWRWKVGSGAHWRHGTRRVCGWAWDVWDA